MQSVEELHRKMSVLDSKGMLEAKVFAATPPGQRAQGLRAPKAVLANQRLCRPPPWHRAPLDAEGWGFGRR